MDEFAKLPWQDQLGVVASVVAIAGIPLTLIRTWRTAGAIRDTEKRLAGYQLFVLVSGVRQWERDLDVAVRTAERQSVTDALMGFRVTANRLQALLASGQADEAELKKLLATAVMVAHDAKETVVDLKKATAAQYRDDLKKATRPLARAIAGAADKADEIAMRITTSGPRSQ